jgi:L-ascorbate metabolism protein UlaG (beta-lactamase superfamily)
MALPCHPGATRLILVCCLIGALWASATLVAQDAPSRQALTITFLVNEGFLIQTGEHDVLIDAFVQAEYYGYGALSDETYKAMIGRKAPFESIELALTSHVHLDHFQVDPAAYFLRAHPDAALMSSEEVILAIRNAPGEPSVGNQGIVTWPEEGKIRSFEHGGIRVDAFRLRHVGDRNREVQNLGLLMHVGDWQILHVGDAHGSADNFEPHKLTEKDIDVAILPTWMFDDRELIDQQIGARHYIAAHIPAAELASTKREFASAHPDVIVLDAPMAQWSPKE